MVSTSSSGPRRTPGRDRAGIGAEILAWSVQPGSTMQLLAAIGIAGVLWQFLGGGLTAAETLSSLAGLSVLLWKSPSGLRRLASYAPSLLEPGPDPTSQAPAEP